MTDRTTKTMQACHIINIRRHLPSGLLNYEWFSVELENGINPGTGPTVADAYDAAVLDLTARNIGNA